MRVPRSCVPQRRAAMAAALLVIALSPLDAAVRPPKPVSDHDLAQRPAGHLSEDHSTPIVHVSVWYHVGSKTSVRSTGFAHLFEHMMFKGSKNVEPDSHVDHRERRRAEQRLHEPRTRPCSCRRCRRTTCPGTVARSRSDCDAARGEDAFSARARGSEGRTSVRVENQPYGRLSEIIYDTRSPRIPTSTTIGSMADLEPRRSGRSRVSQHLLRPRERDGQPWSGTSTSTQALQM